MTVELHEDQPLVEPPAVGARQRWLPMIVRFEPGGPTIYPGGISTNDHAAGIIRMPLDFTTLSSLTLVLNPTNTGATNLDVSIRFGGCGELHNTHAQTLNQTWAMTANTFFCVDLLPLYAALLAALAVGDIMRVNVKNNQAAIVTCYGVDMVYT